MKAPRAAATTARIPWPRLLLIASEVVIFFAVLLYLAYPHPSSPALPVHTYVVGKTFPVILVHGFSSTNINDCQVEFPEVKSFLKANRWQGQVISVGYYSHVTNCDVSIVSWSKKHDTTDHCASVYPGHDGTNNEDLRHIACELSWYIWDNWGHKGQTVDIVAHSMGGLITQWMLATHIAALPRALYVQDVFTGGTPYLGFQAVLPCGCLQAQQMLSTDPFMKHLHANAQNPQGARGTNWTMIGSYCDGSTSVGMSGGSKVMYHIPCYPHGGYFNDDNTTPTASLDKSLGKPPNIVNVYTGTGPHSLSYLYSTLAGMTYSATKPAHS